MSEAEDMARRIQDLEERNKRYVEGQATRVRPADPELSPEEWDQVVAIQHAVFQQRVVFHRQRGKMMQQLKQLEKRLKKTGERVAREL